MRDPSTTPRTIIPEETAALAEHLGQCAASASGDFGDVAATHRIAGAGTWLGAGRPVHAGQTLSLERMHGIVDYVPGDLTLTARAGTPLAYLDDITRAEGQWLAMNPAGDRRGTIGATVATASCGPLSQAFGRMRDVVLGVEIVNGSGIISRAGGRVVKNVAGFDLVRLQVGAWGTLGVITEVSLRLRALPEVEETLAITLDVRSSLPAHVVALRDLALAPMSLELLAAPLAARLGLPAAPTWLARLGGNAERVRAQRTRVAGLGEVTVLDSQVWSALEMLESPSCAVARVSHLPMQLVELWLHAHEVVANAGLSPCLAHATVHRGEVRIVIPQSTEMSGDEFAAACASIAQLLALPGGHVVWEQLPFAAWSAVPCVVRDRISAGLRRAFDPHRLLNRGLLGDTPPT